MASIDAVEEQGRTGTLEVLGADFDACSMPASLHVQLEALADLSFSSQNGMQMRARLDSPSSQASRQSDDGSGPS